MQYLAKRLFVIICVLIVFTGCQAAFAAELLEESVVMIRGVAQSFDYVTPWKQTAMSQGIGSGFVIAGNRILTNAHNVSDNKYVEIKKQNSAKKYPAQVAFIGHDCDLAILIVNDAGFFEDMVPLELGGIPKVNTTVSTYGFPIGGQRISVTEGVVSRIQTDVYAHSGADSHLVIQTDAAINPGNSGGPVMQNGKVVGVAFQGLRQGENIGYMIPNTIIKHFLADIEDGEYDSFGSLGFTFYPGLHSQSYKDYLKVPAEQDGIVIISTLMHSSIESVLQAGDVITQIDDFNIDNDGMIWIYGLRLSLSEAVEAKQIGRVVQLAFYRDGKPMTAKAEVALNRPVLEYSLQYDKPPRYVVFAGLTFVPVTRNFLQRWGSGWLMDIPFYLRYLFYNSIQLNTERKRKEYVVLSEIMPDEINVYCENFKNLPVESINGTPIFSIADVKTAFDSATTDNFHIIRFMGSDQPLIIDAAKAKERHKAILQKYDIPIEARLEKQI